MVRGFSVVGGRGMGGVLPLSPPASQPAEPALMAIRAGPVVRDLGAAEKGPWGSGTTSLGLPSVWSLLPGLWGACAVGTAPCQCRCENAQTQPWA